MAILGAGYLQYPFIEKARSMGLETHVFAWAEGAEGKDIADYFYPISILNKIEILQKCRDIGIDGIVSIASDITMPTVNYVAHAMGLIGNPLASILITTDKYEMRKALSANGIDCPKFSFFDAPTFSNNGELSFPLIVKPTDRSGSRGVTKVHSVEEVNQSILKALEHSINGRVIVEEYIESEREFSIECISYGKVHHPIAITDKVTTRAPHFVEIEHHQPAAISEETYRQMFETTKRILDALGIVNGASHTEVYLLSNGDIRVVECAARMGGDFIGSHLVPNTTGYDYMRAVIEVALNQFVHELYFQRRRNKFSGFYAVIPKPGRIVSIKDNSDHFDDIIYCKSLVKVGDDIVESVDGSEKRAGLLIYSSDKSRPLNDPLEVLTIITE